MLAACLPQSLGKNLLLQEQALTCLAILTLFAYFKGQELHCHGISSKDFPCGLRTCCLLPFYTKPFKGIQKGSVECKGKVFIEHLIYFTWPRKSHFHSGHSKPPKWLGILLSFMPNNMSCLCSIRSEIRGFSRVHKLAAGPKILSGCCKRAARILNSKIWSHFEPSHSG